MATEKAGVPSNVCNKAEKRDNITSDQRKEVCCGKDERKHFQSSRDVKIGMNVRITSDPKLLQKLWSESGLGPMDELKAFCNVVGNVQEIEENDNTVKLRWENYDTAWMPLKACLDAGEIQPTLPKMADDKIVNTDQNNDVEKQRLIDPDDESQIKYFGSNKDVKIGDNVRVTKNYDLLEKCWKEAGLETDNANYDYLGVEGIVEKIDENCDTVEIRWTSSDSARLPARACYRSGRECLF